MSAIFETPSSESRANLLAEAAGFLVTIGFATVAHGTEQKDVHKVALGSVMQIAGDLSRGLHQLIETRNYYAAGTLDRQLLEATQLIVYFRAAPDRAAFWLTATDDEMRDASDFKPAAMRRATQASDSMYSTHCALGGHPRSIGRALLPGSPWRRKGEVIALPRTDGTTVEADLKSLLLTDALQHIYTTVLVTIEALDLDALQTMGVLQGNISERIPELADALKTWRESDPLSTVGSIGT
jgi:hypothetical protein